MSIVDLLLCQRCGSLLEYNFGTLKCGNCSATIENGSGIFTTCNGSNCYWGEPGLADMTEVLSLARAKGWKQSIEYFTAKYPKLPHMVTTGDRVDWYHLLDRDHMVILDVGSGLGQTSFLLAKDVTNTVVSLELVKERALFQAIRKEQDGIENLTVINGNFTDTAFHPGTFDMVQFVGVLEWIGFEEEPENPREVQLRALRKVHEILKPSGLVCIGIENRFGLDNFLGARDHSGLRFTSLMPRALADLYVRLRKPLYRSTLVPRSYRTYTYSASGYRRLLSEAGFSHTEIYMVHPNYNHPRCIIKMDNRVIQWFFSKFHQAKNNVPDMVYTSLFRTLAKFKLAAFFAPHFFIVGRK